MICLITNRECKTNGCGERCYKKDSLGYNTNKTTTTMRNKPMNKAEEILSSLSHMGIGSHKAYHHDDTLSAMKEIAELAFDAGIKDGENKSFFKQPQDLHEDAPVKSTWIKQNFN